MIRRFMTWLRRPKGCYVVIYDHGDPDSPTEEYYGYFCSPEEALERFEDLRHGDNAYYNAKVCRIVRDVPELEGAPCL